MRLTSKTGKVVSVLPVTEETDLMIITRDGKIIRLESANIRQTGRSASGVKLVNLEDGDLIAAASCIPNGEVNGNGEGQENLPLQ
jgi:DNA gyrase subunit A